MATILEQVTANSGQLTGWALAVAGATAITIVSTSYRRPQRLRWRLPYLLFIPGWYCVAYSLYSGNRLIGSFLAAIMVRPELRREISSEINDLYDVQRSFLLYSLVFFGVWLLIYLLTWIFDDSLYAGDKK
jgi:hypothetical protein